MASEGERESERERYERENKEGGKIMEGDDELLVQKLSKQRSWDFACLQKACKLPRPLLARGAFLGGLKSVSQLCNLLRRYARHGNLTLTFLILKARKTPMPCMMALYPSRIPSQRVLNLESHSVTT